MKSVLISTRPKWCEKICHEIGKDEMGKPIYKKRIEVRKSAPKEVPFKAYIYCTKQKINGEILLTNDKKVEGRNRGFRDKGDIPLAGKVIGEFICDKLTHMQAYRDKNKVLHLTNIDSDTLQKTCLKSYELFDYISNRDTHTNVTYNGNLWHISDLKIYDKPKELSEFKTPPCDKSEKACGNCKWLVKINTPDVYECECYVEDGRSITRPPQSYMFVEEVGE